MDISIGNFLEWLTNEKRNSAHTIKAYQKDLSQFRKYLKEQYETERPSDVTSVMVRSWLVELMEAGLSRRSVHRKLSSLRSYYRFLRKEGEVEHDPLAAVVAPKLAKRLPVYVEEQPMDELFAPKNFEDSFSGRRDALLLALLYETGMRRAELIGLKPEDVDHRSSQLKVLGKRNKERIIPVSDELLEQIQRYKEERDMIAEDNTLMITDKGKKLYPGFVYSKVNHYLSKVTTQDKKSPHVLRHTFATHLLNRGADLNSIKEILGHASLAATQVYTHNSIEKLKQVYNNTHPKG